MRNATVKMEKWMWKKTLSKLYKNEERIKIELKIIEAIHESKAVDENAVLSP